jgi:hypothetical protein
MAPATTISTRWAPRPSFRACSREERLGPAPSPELKLLVRDLRAALGETFAPARLHRVRLRFPRLRYAAELVDALSGRDSEAPAMFRNVQEAVGSLHDAFMLSGWLERKAARAQTAGREALAQCARAERDRALQQAHAHHREFLALDPGALLARGIEAMASSRSAA